MSLVQDNYKYFIGIISSTSVSPVIGTPVVCKSECASCRNVYTCITCIDNYVYDVNTK